nr:uncharacterized protein LOC111429082 [Onthophagus taurus]
MRGLVLSVLFLALIAYAVAAEFFVFPEDTTRYYRCGEPLITSCPEGLHFNPISKTCDILVENFPYPEDSTKYYECGDPSIMTCPGGKYFNPVHKFCDWIE